MKQQESESVLHDWVCKLPFTQQALLLMATRGADGLDKRNCGKSIVHFIRGAVIKPAYPNFNGECDGYMRTDFVEYLPPTIKAFFFDTDAYPKHFLLHIYHAAEVIGYNYPDHEVSELFKNFYYRACEDFHMTPETKEQLNNRLKY